MLEDVGARIVVVHIHSDQYSVLHSGDCRMLRSKLGAGTPLTNTRILSMLPMPVPGSSFLQALAACCNPGQGVFAGNASSPTLASLRYRQARL